MILKPLVLLLSKPVHENPCGRCTKLMAPNIIMAGLAAVNLVRNPARSATLPNDSPMIIRNTISHGSPLH